jgi:hypothetical protein
MKRHNKHLRPIVRSMASACLQRPDQLFSKDLEYQPRHRALAHTQVHFFLTSSAILGKLSYVIDLN